MSLITCPECGGAISTTAHACPHCGMLVAPPSTCKSEAKVAPPLPGNLGSIVLEPSRPPFDSTPDSPAGSPIPTTSSTQNESPHVHSPPPHVESPVPDARLIGQEKADASDLKPLWNPILIAILAVPLGYVFASVLVALNWHALRRHFFGALVWLAAILFCCFVQYPLLNLYNGPLWPYLIGFVVWFPIVGLPQVIYFRKHHASYQKRGWLIPVSIGIAVNVMFVIWMKWENRVAQWDQEQNPVQKVVESSDQQRELLPEELVKQMGPLVFEVQTRWREPYWIFLSRENGMDGSAVLLRSGSGSYFFVTNRHVVEPPSDAENYSCTINTSDGQIAALVVGYGKNGVDLALIRVDSEEATKDFELPTLPLQGLAVGQSCAAIGNALGGGDSITTGIVSRIDEIGNCPVIRTSAPISPGNSGGGLFAMRGGYLIGLTTASIDADSVQNINFAIPTDYFVPEDSWDSVTIPGQ